MLFGVNQRLRVEDVDSPLIQIRAVKTVLLVCVTGDRGLCGGYNSLAIRKVSGNIRQCFFMLLASNWADPWPSFIHSE